MRVAIIIGVGLQLLLGCAEGEQIDPQLFSSPLAGSPAGVPTLISAAGAIGQAGSISFGGAAGNAAEPMSLGGSGGSGARGPAATVDASSDALVADSNVIEASLDITPRVEAGLAPTGISLLYKCSDTNPNYSQMAPSYKIVNAGGPSLNLSDLKVRYFMSDEGNAKLLPDFIYAEVNGGAGYRDIRNLATVQITAAVPAVAGADKVVELSFGAGAGTLTDGQTSTINFVVHTEGYSLNLNEANDYSHDISKTDFGVNGKVTLYLKDQLIAGIEP